MSQAPAGAGRTAPRLFRGWAVVAGVFCLMAIASGLGFYNASVYLEAVVVERGIPIAVASAASATFFVSFGLAGLPISRWIAERDPRPVILGGAVVGGVALLGLGAASTAWQLVVVFATLGVGFAGISFVPGTMLINRWFVRHRALGLTLATTGLSIGGIAITPVSAGAIERTGLDEVAPWLALTWFVGVVVVVATLIRPSPAAYGLEPDGDPRPATEPVPIGGLTPSQVYRTATYWLLAAGVTLLMLSQVGALAHLYGIGVDRVGEATAATAVSTVAASSVAGRFLGVWVLRHLDALRFTSLLAGLQVVSMALLAVDAGQPGLLLATGLFGLSVGNLLVLVPVVLVETFGIGPYARVFAMNQLVATLGIASGPILFGTLRDAYGSYTPGAASASAVSVAATVLIVLAMRARRREQLVDGSPGGSADAGAPPAEPPRGA